MHFRCAIFWRGRSVEGWGNNFSEPQEQYQGWSDALREIAKTDKAADIDYNGIVGFCEQFDLPKIGESLSWGGTFGKPSAGEASVNSQ